MIPDNAWILRITAAAGTELADPYSHSTVKTLHVMLFLPVQKQFTIHRTVILHAASLIQPCRVREEGLRVVNRFCQGRNALG